MKEKLPASHLTDNEKTSRERFFKELECAVEKYGDNHIDIAVDRDSDKLVAYYHSENNSFNVSNIYNSNILSNKDLDTLTDGSEMCWDETTIV